MDVGFILNLPWLREFFFFYYASCHHFPMLYVFHGLAFHSYQLQINLDEEKVVFFLLLLLHSFQHVCYLWGVMYGPVWCGIYMNIEHALYRWWWWHTIYSRCARAKRYWNYNGGEGKFLYQFFFLFCFFCFSSCDGKYWKMVKRMVYLRRKFLLICNEERFDIWCEFDLEENVICELIYLISISIYVHAMTRGMVLDWE